MTPAEIEAALGPTRAMFEAAFALALPKHYMPGRSGIGPGRWELFARRLDVAAWTSAAEMLVPEGWSVEMFVYPNGRARVTLLEWFEGSKHDATDDCSWYRFSKDKVAPTRYHWPAGRQPIDKRQGVLL